jgi:hypothetical protein
MARTGITLNQLDLVLCDIATAAKQIDRLSALLISDSLDLAEGDGEVFRVSIQMLAQRIGWAADMAMMNSVSSIGPCFGDAVDWMMPPLFHEKVEQPPSDGRA